VTAVADVRENAHREVEMLPKQPPSSRVSGVSFAAAGLTRGGKIQGVNEDAILVQKLSSPHLPDGASGLQGDTSKHGIALGVFDGMGGSGAGDVASQLAAATVGDQLRRAFGRVDDVSAWAQALHDAMAAANQAIFRRAQADVHLRGCGAVATVATVSGATLIVAHVGSIGNSRAHLLRGGNLTALTRDRSLSNGCLDLTAMMSPEEQGAFPSSVVIRALGIKESVDVEVVTLPLCDGDTLLLCTDGALELLDEQIAAILSRSDPPEELCAALDAACAAGEVFDDRAVVVARFSAQLFASARG
jgi:serine/threonine protein phosphatase PrpC